MGMFDKEIEATKEIASLKQRYNLSAEKVFVLQTLKFAELSNASYEKMKNYFIELSINQSNHDRNNQNQEQVTKEEN